MPLLASQLARSGCRADRSVGSTSFFAETSSSISTRLRDRRSHHAGRRRCDAAGIQRGRRRGVVQDRVSAPRLHRRSARPPAGRRNRLWFEIDGAHASVAFDQEDSERLWIGRPDQREEVFVRGPGAGSAEQRRLAIFSAGHAQGYGNCFEAFVADTWRAPSPAHTCRKASSTLVRCSPSIFSAPIVARVITSARPRVLDLHRPISRDEHLDKSAHPPRKLSGQRAAAKKKVRQSCSALRSRHEWRGQTIAVQMYTPRNAGTLDNQLKISSTTPA